VTIEALQAEPLDGRFRSLGVHPGVTVGTVGAQGWNLARRDLPFPVMALRESALASNLRVFHGWCERHGVSLAPHGKTTLAPQLIRRQLEAGAWGMTAATVHQIGVMALGGARRVLLANEVAGVEEARWLELLRQEQGIEIWPFVDSVRGVELLAAAPRATPLPVLLELGDPGGRAGCRDGTQARAVADAVAQAGSLVLAGVTAWEGGLPSAAQVDALLTRTHALAHELDEEGRFDGDEIILSAGGSLFFDRVAELLRPDGFSRPARTIVRSGCYLTHDHGIYATGSPLRDELRPALQLWGQILSCPEPGLALAGFGKRDAPYDLGLPLVEERIDAAGTRHEAHDVEVTAFNDQHAFLAHDGSLEVGDLVVCGISHPCTAFDKWSLLPVVDDEATVIDAVRTLC
jgi:D-serine dehydratase